MAEVGRAVSAVSDREAGALAAEILRAKRIYLNGMGRSGLVSSCFAMRLVHMGLTAHVVGEATAPGVRKGDLLVASSGSGRTRTVLAQAEAARSHGAKVAAVTADGGSPLAALADVAVVIPCPPYARRGPVRRSLQPGGTLFEQSLLVFYDGLVLDLAERLGLSEREMRMRHSNLE